MKKVSIYMGVLIIAVAVFAVAFYGMSVNATTSALMVAGIAMFAMVIGVVQFVRSINRDGDHSTLLTSALATVAGAAAFAAVIAGTAPLQSQFTNIAAGLVVLAPSAAFIFSNDTRWVKFGIVNASLAIAVEAAIFLLFWLVSGQPKLTLPPWLPL